MEKQAQIDVLTGLPNRIFLKNRLNLVLKNSRRDGNMFAVMFLDLDGFKLINDTLGHSIGDQLLQEVANVLKRCLRAEDVVIRFGGDEFIILLQHINCTKDTVKVAKKILDIFQQNWIIKDHKIHITASIGIAVNSKKEENGEILIRNADFAMYQAKKKGKNNYQFYNAIINCRE